MLTPDGSASGKARPRARRHEPLPPLVSAALEPGAPSLEARLERLAAHAGGRARYEILGEIGQGGMGRVLRVWDAALTREVAMKIVPREPRPDASEEEKHDHERRLLRFVEEARITGQLDHPGIVPVHEVGLDGVGNVYFTMPLVRGQNLKRVFEHVHLGEEGWTLQRVVSVMHTVCLTVAFAHQKGVVHRDLKPENIMVGTFGEAYVMDWGLALLIGRQEKGGIVGTPAYMSPEQAAGRSQEVGPASDVYSLGAILYELFAKRMPHELSLEVRAREQESLEQILAAPPRPLHELDESVPPELAAICAKAMAPSPHDRYAGAREMADDLDAWLAGRVVSVHPTSHLARLRKWRTRNRALAFALDALAALFLVSAVAFFWQQRTFLREVRAKHEEVRISAYSAGLSAADLGLRAHETGESRRRLEACDPELRGWEWRHLALRADASARVLAEHESAVRSVAVSPDGRLLASGDDEGQILLWDALSGTRRARLTGHARAITAVAFAPDGTRIASASNDRTVRIWDVASATIERSLDDHAAEVSALAFSLDGRLLASGSADGEIVLAGVSDGRELARHSPAKLDGIVALEFVPGTGALAAAFLSGHLRLLDPDRLEPLREVQVSKSALTGMDADPTGAHLAVAFERTAQVLDGETLEPLHTLAGHGSKISGLAFAPDGTRLATVSYDNVLRVWHLATGRIQEFEGHDEDVNGVAFYPGGERLVTGSEDHSLRLWSLSRAPTAMLIEGSPWVDSLAIAPGGERIAAGTHDSLLRVLELASGRELARLETPGIVDCVAWAADDLLAFGCGETAPRLAPAATPAESRMLAGGQSFPRTLLVAPGGRKLFVRDSNGRVAVLDLALDSGRVELEAGGDGSSTLALSPDGARLVAGTQGGEILVWDAHTLEPLAPWRAGKAAVTALAFSPDGACLAVGRQNRSITLLARENGALERVLDGHESLVSCLAFTPDGRRLVSGSYDHTLRVWDPENEESLLVLRGHGAPVTAVAFDPRGEVLASASKDGSLRVWRTARAFDAEPTAPTDESPR